MVTLIVIQFTESKILFTMGQVKDAPTTWREVTWRTRNFTKQHWQKQEKLRQELVTLLSKKECLTSDTICIWLIPIAVILTLCFLITIRLLYWTSLRKPASRPLSRNRTINVISYHEHFGNCKISTICLLFSDLWSSYTIRRSHFLCLSFSLIIKFYSNFLLDKSVLNFMRHLQICSKTIFNNIWQFSYNVM